MRWRRSPARSREAEDAVLERGATDRPSVVQIALPQSPRLTVPLVGKLVESAQDIPGLEVHQRHLADRGVAHRNDAAVPVRGEALEEPAGELRDQVHLQGPRRV